MENSNSISTSTIELNNDAPIIKVVGVGGAGGNAVSHMISRGVEGVEFIAANTDAQALNAIGAHTIIKLGANGLGAGANPTVGREAAIAERRRIAQALEGSNMVFITAGMGGGTGTGAAPVVAEIARELGILTVGVVTKPFDFEGNRRMRAAQQGIEELQKHVDSLIVVLNDKLLEVLGEDITQTEAFKAADNVLYNATAGVAEVITKPGLINVDFQDVKTVMSERGRAMMGAGTANGPDRARIAAEMAIACPLLEGVELRGARGLLVNICASQETMKMRESKEIMNVIRQYVDEEAIIIIGAVTDDTMGDDLRVTLIATGLENGAERRQAAEQENPFQPIAKVWTSQRSESASTTTQVEPAAKPAAQAQERAAKAAGGSRYDIPAFLRKYSGGH